MQPRPEATFVVDLLTELRGERFRAGAWGRFLQRSWRMSWQTARLYPTLTRSWLQLTCFVGLLALLILLSSTLLSGVTDTLRLLPGFLFCLAWQQADLFWHLGLNRSTQSGQLLPRIGTANVLTWLRGLGASYLLGTLLGGLALPSGLALAVFLGGIATDILDGLVARLTGTQSKLGQIADAEADFCLYLALTFILLQNGVLPLWVGCVMLLRFVIPLVAALLSYLAFARPVCFGSTLWGKYAGLAQCLYFLVLLAPTPVLPLAHLLNIPLLVITICLLIVAPIAQFMANIRGEC